MKKPWMTRILATGLIVLMACVNPMQTLEPKQAYAAGEDEDAGSSDTGSDADVVNTDGTTTYIREVRLGVGKTPAEAKRALNGYTILDQDLNEGAGSWWNDIGDQSVYLGYTTTTKESEALRDIKLMNMLGKYSVSGYEVWLDGNRAEAKSLYGQVRPAIDEFKDNYEKKDEKTVALYDMLNRLKEDDSGKSIAELITSSGLDEDTFIKLMVQGNSVTVNVMLRMIAAGCERGEDTWIERLQTCNTYNDVIKAYAGEKGLTGSVTGTVKNEIENEMARDLQPYAMKLADLWPTFRASITKVSDEIAFDENASDINASEETEKEASDVEAADFSEDGDPAEAVSTELSDMNEFRDESITMYLRTSFIREPDIITKKDEAKLDPGVTLYDFFTQKTNTVSKNNAKALIPLAYVLSEGQRSMLDYTDLFDLTQIAMERISLRSGTETQDEESQEVTEAVQENANLYVEMVDSSIYDGVDRSAYLGNTAKTSEAQAEETATGVSVNKRENYVMWGALGLGAGFLIAAGITHIVNSRNVRGLEYQISRLSTQAKQLQESLSPSGIETLKENINRKINELSWDIDHVKNELADLIAEDGIMGHNYKGFIRSKRIRLAQLKDELNYYNSPDAYAGKKAAEMKEELTRVQEEQQKLESAKNSIAPKVVQVVAVVISAAMFAVSAYYYYKQMKAEHNIEQLPIPERMVDFDVTNEAGKYINYTSVKWQKDRSAYLQEGEKVEDRADRADLNGDAAKQWLVPYVTYDSAAGKPILAEGLTVKLGKNDSDPMSAPADGKDYTYQSLRLFHQKNAQNLVDEAYSFKDKLGGLYLFYRVAGEDAATAAQADESTETEKTENESGGSEDATEAAETASLTSSGNTVLAATLGGVGGIIVGLLIGTFFRRKKTTEIK